MTRRDTRRCIPLLTVIPLLLGTMNHARQKEDAALLLANLVNLVLGLGLVHVARYAFGEPRSA